VIFPVVLPCIGLFADILAQGDSMGERSTAPSVSGQEYARLGARIVP
jgi:hypothetical protein